MGKEDKTAKAARFAVALMLAGWGLARLVKGEPITREDVNAVATLLASTGVALWGLRRRAQRQARERRGAPSSRRGALKPTLTRRILDRIRRKAP